MERLYRRLRGSDFVMLAVSEDEGGTAAVQPFVDQLGLTFPILIDTEGTIPPRYGVTGYPETFIIDREGRVVQHLIGPEDWGSEEVIGFFTRLLEPQPATTNARGERDQAGS